MDIEKALYKIFAKLGHDLGNKEVMAEMDSLRFIELIVEIEHEFKIEIPDEYLDGSILDKDVLINIVASLI